MTRMESVNKLVDIGIEIYRSSEDNDYVLVFESKTCLHCKQLSIARKPVKYENLNLIYTAWSIWLKFEYLFKLDIMFSTIRFLDPY